MCRFKENKAYFKAKTYISQARYCFQLNLVPVDDGLGELVEEEVDGEPCEEALLHRVHDLDQRRLGAEPGGTQHLLNLACKKVENDMIISDRS